MMSANRRPRVEDLKFALCVLVALVVVGLFVLSIHL